MIVQSSDRAVSLDKIDYKILKSSLEDGRISYSAIAKETDLTDVAIKKRVDSLKRKGVISSITADINYDVLGFQNPLYIQIRSDISKNKDIVKRLNSFDYVVELYQVLGEYNFLAKLVMPNVGYAEKFIGELGALDGVKDIKTLVVLSKIKNTPTLPSSALQKRL